MVLGPPLLLLLLHHLLAPCHHGCMLLLQRQGLSLLLLDNTHRSCMSCSLCKQRLCL
jgi:hypothetical protein